MVGDDAANAAIPWLSKDSFVPILFRRLKPVYGKTTFEAVRHGQVGMSIFSLPKITWQKLSVAIGAES
jgi:hypothetical protein